MTIKRASGRDKFLGKATPIDVDALSVAGNDGVLAYGPLADDATFPDMRIIHNGVKHKILTADPSSAGQPLQIVDTPFTITVHHDPSEQADYTSVRDALLYCAKFYAPPDLTALYGTVLIKSGHIEGKQTQIRRSNLAWVGIVSEDNDVMVDSQSFLGDPFFGGGGNALFLFQDTQLPVWRVHFVNDEVAQGYTLGFNLSGRSNFTLPTRDPGYYTEVDLDGVPGKRYGCSGFDVNLVMGGTSTGALMPSAKFSRGRRDGNVSVGENALIALYGGDFTGYRGQYGIRCSGRLGIQSLPSSTELPFREPVPAPPAYYPAPDLRKDPTGAPAVHDILLTWDGMLTRRGGFYGTCNVPTNHTIAGWGRHYFFQSSRNPRLFQSDMIGFEPVTRKEMLPDARAYRNAIAAVREGYPDDGEGVLTLYLSDRGEWRPLQAGGLALPPPPTFTDNGDGTFTLS